MQQLTPEMLLQLRKTLEEKQRAGMCESTYNQEAKKQSDRLNNNPLPEGNAGIQILRSINGCPIPEESKNLHMTLTEALQKSLSSMEPDEIENTEIENTIIRAAEVAVKMNRTCSKNLSKIVVIDMKNDEKLKEYNEKLMSLEKEGMELQEKLRSIVQEGQSTLIERWNYAVKNYGLSPANTSYMINEEDSTLVRVHLDCEKCEGAAQIKQISKDVAALLKKKED